MWKNKLTVDDILGGCS